MLRARALAARSQGGAQAPRRRPASAVAYRLRRRRGLCRRWCRGWVRSGREGRGRRRSGRRRRRCRPRGGQGTRGEPAGPDAAAKGPALFVGPRQGDSPRSEDKGRHRQGAEEGHVAPVDPAARSPSGQATAEREPGEGRCQPRAEQRRCGSSGGGQPAGGSSFTGAVANGGGHCRRGSRSGSGARSSERDRYTAATSGGTAARSAAARSAAPGLAAASSASAASAASRDRPVTSSHDDHQQTKRDSRLGHLDSRQGAG